MFYKRQLGAFFIGCYNSAMPTVETRIWIALKSRIETLMPSVDKAYPAQKYMPEAGKPFIRVGKVQADPQRIVLADGKPHRRTGSLILTLVHPIDQDTAFFEEMQGQIAAHFADGTSMTFLGVCVSVSSYPAIQSGYESDGWWNAPVVIRWRCVA